MKKKAIVGIIFTILVFLLLLIPNDEISNSISQTVIFCGQSVIPQLFLYICLSSIVWESGIVENIISAFPRYGVEISVFFMGILSGFPSGAIITGNLCEKGIITKKRAEYLLTFSNNAGISFVFGYVSSILGKTGAFSVFTCQIIFSVIFAVIGRKALSQRDKRQYATLTSKTPSFSSLVNSIKNATKNMINICGFILFFSAFSTSIISSAHPIFKGLVEMTTGLSSLSSLSYQSRLWYSALFLGFGGLCVHFQILAACNVSPKSFFVSKCISALLFPPSTLFIHNFIVKVF